MPSTETEFSRIEQLLASASSNASASAADGRLLSLAAMLGDEAPAIWLRDLAPATGAATLGPLGEIAGARVRSLADTDALPLPWLPGDEDDLRDRVEAVVDWAGGFLAGLGEGAAMRGTPARERLEVEPLAELVSDLTEISRAALTAEELDEDPEAAEAAYAEIVEYLRVLAQLAFEELAPVRELASAADANLH
jgi:uncharacterized protein YgfB (UPF0149 family)